MDKMLSQSPKTFTRSAYGRGRTKRPCFVRFRSVWCEEFGDDVLSFATYYAIARTDVFRFFEAAISGSTHNSIAAYIPALKYKHLVRLTDRVHKKSGQLIIS